MALFEAELGPALALGDAGVDVFFDNGGADAAGGFDTLAVVVEAVGYDGFSAVFIRGYSLGWQGCGVVEVVFDVVGPVWTADRMLERLILVERGMRMIYLANFDMVVNCIVDCLCGKIKIYGTLISLDVANLR